MKRKINILFIFISIFVVITAFLNIYDKDFNHRSNRGEKEEEATDAMESFQYMSEIRAFPNVDIPPDKFYKAFEYVKNSMTEISTPNYSPTAWTSIGPNNIGGRSLCIICSPADTGTLFMGSASGGLWKSTTGGLGANAWTLINTGYPSNAVSSIAIDSVNPNVMYIGTGENYGYQYSLNGLNIRVTRGMYGIGILKTIDGGNTWTKSLDWSYQNQRGVWRVVINPKNHNTLYSATSEGVYKSLNAGATWNQILNYQMVMDLVINSQDTSNVIISVGDLSNNVPNANTGMYKTSNAGTSWTKLSDGTHGLPTFWSGKTTLATYTGNPNFVYASIGNDPNASSSYLGLFQSTDAGNTWTIKYNSTSFMTNQGWYNNALLIKSNDANQILLGNLDIYRSINGGTSFTSMTNWNAWITGPTPPGQPESPSQNFSHADQHYFYSNPKEPNKVYSITDGGLYRSNDFGTTFYSCNGGYVTTQFYATLANSYQDSIFCIGGLQDNRAAFYQGTTAWYKTFVGDGMCCAVNSTNSQICYTEYAFGDINKSVNGGVSWSDIGLPGSGSESNYCFAAPYICCKSNPNIMYGGGSSIYKSVTGGNSWTSISGNLGKVFSMDCSSTSTDTVYAGIISGSAIADIYRTTDGQNWSNVSNGTVPNAYPTDIHVNLNNSKEVYATFGGFGVGHIYKTTNAGTTWTNISGNLPDLPHHCVCIDPQYPQNIYVGNDIGVFATTNNGVNWYSYSNGMPYALVFDLAVVYPNRHIRAATHGNGIYERSLIQNPLLGVINNSEIPKDFILFQNYPNPFNPTTKIKYQLPKSEYVTLSIYDISGKLVQSLVNEKQNAGAFEVKFDAKNISSGIYFYKLISGDFASVKKLILIK